MASNTKLKCRFDIISNLLYKCLTLKSSKYINIKTKQILNKNSKFKPQFTNYLWNKLVRGTGSD